MKTFASFFLFFLTIICVSQNVFAQSGDYKYGNVIYQIPSGYHQDMVDSTLVLMPKGQSVDDAEIAFMVTPGIDNIPKNLSNSLNILVSKLESGRQVLKRQSSTDSSNGLNIASEISITRTETETYISIYILTNPGGRGEFFAIVANSAEAIEKYQSQIAEFFGGISFANLNNNSTATYSSNRSYSNSNSSRNQQLQRNRANTNQIFLNSITNNYNSLSRSF